MSTWHGPEMASSPQSDEAGGAVPSQPCRDGVEILPHRLGETEVQRIGDQRVADGDLVDVADGDERGEIVEVEVVSGVDPESELRRAAGGVEIGLPAGAGVRVVEPMVLDEVGVGAGVELDAVRPALLRARDLLLDRVHEQAHACPPALVAGDHLRHPRGFRGLGKVPAVVRRELRVAVGHQRRLVRTGGLDEVVEPRITVVPRPGGGIALDVVLDARVVGGQHPRERMHVVRPDVALVGTRMHGDALRPGGDDGARRVEDAGAASLARVAQPRDLVEVDGEGGHDPRPKISATGRRSSATATDTSRSPGRSILSSVYPPSPGAVYTVTVSPDTSTSQASGIPAVA